MLVMNQEKTKIDMLNTLEIINPMDTGYSFAYKPDERIVVINGNLFAIYDKSEIEEIVVEIAKAIKDKEEIFILEPSQVPSIEEDTTNLNVSAGLKSLSKSLNAFRDAMRSVFHIFPKNKEIGIAKIKSEEQEKEKVPQITNDASYFWNDSIVNNEEEGQTNGEG